MMHDTIRNDDVQKKTIGFFIQKQNASIDFKKIAQNDLVISVYYISAPLNYIYPNIILPFGHH